MEIARIGNLGDLDKLNDIKEVLLIELMPGESATLERGERESLVVISFEGMIEIRVQVKGRCSTRYVANYSMTPRVWWRDGDAVELFLHDEANKKFRGLVLRMQYLKS